MIITHQPFSLLTVACLASHDYHLSGWVINACFVLDNVCGFTSKSLLYASKLCASCFQWFFVPSPRCEVLWVEVGDRGHRTLWLGVVEEEGLQGALGEKDPFFQWQQAMRLQTYPISFVICSFLLPLSLP